MLTPAMTASSGSPPAAIIGVRLADRLEPVRRGDDERAASRRRAAGGGRLDLRGEREDRRALEEIPPAASAHATSVRMPDRPRSRSLVRQLRLFLDLPLRAGRQQVHQQVREVLGELAARHDARDAGLLRASARGRRSTCERNPIDRQRPRLRRSAAACRTASSAPSFGELDEHRGGPRLRSTPSAGPRASVNRTGHVQMARGRVDLRAEEEIFQAGDDRFRSWAGELYAGVVRSRAACRSEHLHQIDRDAVQSDSSGRAAAGTCRSPGRRRCGRP